MVVEKVFSQLNIIDVRDINGNYNEGVDLEYVAKYLEEREWLTLYRGNMIGINRITNLISKYSTWLAKARLRWVSCLEKE